MNLIGKLFHSLNRLMLNRFDLQIVRTSWLHNLEGQMSIARNLKDQAGTWVIAEIEGSTRLWLDLGDYGVSRWCLSGTYEPIETAFLRSVLRPGMAFVDVGANVGWFTMIAASIVGPSGKVYAFEPRPDTHSRLALSAAENNFSWVETKQVALGESPSKMVIAALLSAQSPGGTWLLATDELDALQCDGYERFEVDVVRMDDVGISRCDVLKIDIEGAEGLAFKGAREFLCKHRPLIISEINPYLLNLISKCSPHGYAEMICSFGYTPHYLTFSGPGLQVEMAEFEKFDDVVNVAFVPKRL